MGGFQIFGLYIMRIILKISGHGKCKKCGGCVAMTLI